jgi:hypothetical protein
MKSVGAEVIESMPQLHDGEPGERICRAMQRGRRGKTMRCDQPSQALPRL